MYVYMYVCVCVPTGERGETCKYDHLCFTTGCVCVQMCFMFMCVGACMQMSVCVAPNEILQVRGNI